MPLTVRDIAVAVSAFGLAVLTLHQNPTPVVRKIPAMNLQGPVASLSQNQKMQAALTQLKGKVNFRGVRALTTLTPNAPVVKSVAKLSFKNALEYTTSFEPGSTGSIYGYGEDQQTAPYNLGIQIEVDYFLAHPSATHVVTLYLRCYGKQTLKINGQDVKVEDGLHPVPIAQIGGQGAGHLYLRKENKGTFSLYKVEIDVLE